MRPCRWAGSWRTERCPTEWPPSSRVCCAESIAYGWANRDEALVTIRRHAQEMDESVIWPYVELYVNDHTVDLGAEGARALAVLERTGRAAGLFAGDLPPLTVVG